MDLLVHSRALPPPSNAMCYPPGCIARIYMNIIVIYLRVRRGELSVRDISDVFARYSAIVHERGEDSRIFAIMWDALCAAKHMDDALMERCPDCTYQELHAEISNLPTRLSEVFACAKKIFAQSGASPDTLVRLREHVLMFLRLNG